MAIALDGSKWVIFNYSDLETSWFQAGKLTERGEVEIDFEGLRKLETTLKSCGSELRSTGYLLGRKKLFSKSLN